MTTGRLLGRLAHQFLRHVLPLFLMLLIAGWLTLKAGASIEEGKQLPTYAILDEG